MVEYSVARSAVCLAAMMDEMTVEKRGACWAGRKAALMVALSAASWEVMWVAQTDKS